MIYPPRIKNNEYPLKKGDIVVCITKLFNEFTYAKQYTLYSDQEGSLLPIQSDFNNQPLPAYYSPNEYYFLPINIFRELQINQIVDNHES